MIVVRIGPMVMISFMSFTFMIMVGISIGRVVWIVSLAGYHRIREAIIGKSEINANCNERDEFLHLTLIIA